MQSTLQAEVVRSAPHRYHSYDFRVSVCVCVFMYMYICMYMYVYVCIYRGMCVCLRVFASDSHDVPMRFMSKSKHY